MLMIAKNNYYWTEQLALQHLANAQAEGKTPEEAETLPFDFIANGDTAIVRRIRRQREFYGFTFADAELTFPDYDDFTMEATVLIDTLQTEAPALSKEQQDTLFNNIRLQNSICSIASEDKSSALAIGNWLLVIGESCSTNSSLMRSASTTVTTASNLGNEAPLCPP